VQVEVDIPCTSRGGRQLLTLDGLGRGCNELPAPPELRRGSHQAPARIRTSAPSSVTILKSRGGWGALLSSQAAPKVLDMGCHDPALLPLTRTFCTAPRPPVSSMARRSQPLLPAKSCGTTDKERHVLACSAAAVIQAAEQGEGAAGGAERMFRR
jgi:hypothetical protein